MKKIIVPTDFSFCASNAVNFAVQSVKTLPAAVTILHSFEVKGNVYTDYMGVNKEFNQQMLNEAQERLNLLKNNIADTEGITVDTIVSIKSLNESIKDTAKAINADMVVMGTLGASGIGKKYEAAGHLHILGTLIYR